MPLMPYDLAVMLFPPGQKVRSNISGVARRVVKVNHYPRKPEFATVVMHNLNTGAQHGYSYVLYEFEWDE